MTPFEKSLISSPISYGIIFIFREKTINSAFLDVYGGEVKLFALLVAVYDLNLIVLPYQKHSIFRKLNQFFNLYRLVDVHTSLLLNFGLFQMESSERVIGGDLAD